MVYFVALDRQTGLGMADNCTWDTRLKRQETRASSLRTAQSPGNAPVRTLESRINSMRLDPTRDNTIRFDDVVDLHHCWVTWFMWMPRWLLDCQPGIVWLSILTLLWLLGDGDRCGDMAPKAHGYPSVTQLTASTPLQITQSPQSKPFTATFLGMLVGVKPIKRVHGLCTKLPAVQVATSI